MYDIDWGEVADSTAEAVSDGASALYQGVKDYGTKAFQWIEDNPETSQIIAGVVGGAGQYLAAKEQQKSAERFEMDMMERRRKERQIKPGEIENYGTHIGEVKKGLLTNGMIAGGN